MADPPILIRGGAGPYEAAAVVAAVLQVLAEEEAKAVPPPPPRPHPWVLAGRLRPVQPPLYVEAGPTVVGWGLGPAGGGDDA